MHDWVLRPELDDKPLVFVVGAFAHGKVRRRACHRSTCMQQQLGCAACNAQQRPRSPVPQMLYPACLHLKVLLFCARLAPQIDDSYVDQYISISQFPLSAAYALGRITNALEQKWAIV
jgi:rRNA pseudouridine-1189 N-methylase Emg1 (Nep1/Mra1 family)